MDQELQKGIERLEDVRFWLANLRHFNKFTPLQRGKLSNAYKIINEVYKAQNGRHCQNEP
jgi:hypothetical protein